MRRRNRGDGTPPSCVVALADATGLGEYEATLRSRRRRPALQWLSGPPIWLFSEGLVVIPRPGAEPSVVPWVNAHIRYTPTHVGAAYNSVSITPGRYTVERDDGFRFSDTYQPFTEQLIRRIAEAQYPRAIATLAAGRQIAFGPVRVDSAAIRVRGHVVPWADLLALHTLDDRLVLRRRGRLRSIRVPIGAVTDLHVLLEIGRRRERRG